MPRQRLIVATLLFLGAFAVIAQLAWNTATATSGPWFSPAISRDVYSTTMIAATVLVAVLAALASGQSASAAREARALDLRLNILRGSGVIVSGSGGIDIDADIEDTLNEILGGVDGSAAPMVTMDREAHDTLVAVTAEGKALRQDVVLREVARARSANVQTARGRSTSNRSSKTATPSTRCCGPDRPSGAPSWPACFAPSTSDRALRSRTSRCSFAIIRPSSSARSSVG